MPKSHAVAAALVLGAWAAVAHAAPVPGLFTTGVDDLGAVLQGGSVDPLYSLISSADPPSAIVTSVIPAAYWFANNATSKWIDPNADENYPALGTPHPGGDYLYRLSFDLTGFDPATVAISGTWGVDNSGSIRLNGVATGQSNTSYNPLVPFAISTGFVAGVNHLNFVINNLPSSGSNPTGLRVGSIAGSGTSIVGVGPGSANPALELAAPFPNPARGMARFSYGLSRPGSVRLVVRDLAGRAIRTLVDGERMAGRFESRWDGRGDDGLAARAGLYLLDLQAEGRRLSRRFAWIP